MKTLLIITSTILAMLFLLVGIPYIMGYKIMYSTNASYDYQAISAYGQWVSALVPIVLVFLSVYVTNKFDKTKKEINQQNLATVDYVNEMIKGLSLFQDNGPKSGSSTEEIDNQILKERAYKYVSIAGFSKTENVAKHLGVTKDHAFELLNELLRVDGKISAGGRATKENIDNVLWLKKK